MTKQTLIGIVQKSLANNGLSVGKREAAAVVDDVFASIKSEAETNGFSYPKFGKFYTAKTKGKTMNLAHLKPGLTNVVVPEKNRIRFKASAAWVSNLQKE